MSLIKRIILWCFGEKPKRKYTKRKKHPVMSYYQKKKLSINGKKRWAEARRLGITHGKLPSYEEIAAADLHGWRSRKRWDRTDRNRNTIRRFHELL